MERFPNFAIALLVSLVVEIAGECTVSYRQPDIRPCPEDINDDGIDCWRGSYEREGRVPDKAPCPSGLRDDGTSCWSEEHRYPCTSWGCCSNCKAGYRREGCDFCRKTAEVKLTLFQRYRCKSGEEIYDKLCYPKCKEGYYASGCCICVALGKAGILIPAKDRKYCKDGSPLVDGQCQVEECS